MVLSVIVKLLCMDLEWGFKVIKTPQLDACGSVFFYPWETLDTCRFLVQIKLVSVVCFSWGHNIFRPFCLCTKGSTCRVRSLGLFICKMQINLCFPAFHLSSFQAMTSPNQAINNQCWLLKITYFEAQPFTMWCRLCIYLAVGSFFCVLAFVPQRSWLLAAKPVWPDGCLPF